MPGKFQPDCPKCGKRKTLYGGVWDCPECHRKYQREYWKRTGGNTPARVQENKKRALRIRPSGLRDWQVYQLKKYYKLSESEYIAMVKRQNNLCAICKTSTIRRLHVDHCHETKKVRELLCSRCNLALGKFKDDPKILRSAANYLIKHRKKSLR